MKEFTTSRLSSGNMMFPIKVSITNNGVEIIKPGILKKSDESIPFNRIASFGANLHMLKFSDIILTDTSGEKIIIHGFTQSQVKEIKQLLSSYIHK